MKYLETLTTDFNNGKFKNGIALSAKSTASGIRWEIATITDDGKPLFYNAHIQFSKGYNIIKDFVEANNIEIHTINNDTSVFKETKFY